jgi:hypothetical protein
MDEHTANLFTLTRHHTGRVPDDLNIHTVAPQVHILVAALKAQGLDYQLVSSALQSQEGWSKIMDHFQSMMTKELQEVGLERLADQSKGRNPCSGRPVANANFFKIPSG